MKTIDVATCFDERGVSAAAALIASMRHHARNGCKPVRFFVVVPFESEDLHYVARVSKTASFEVIVLRVANAYADYPVRENITSAAYLRYQLPEILSDLRKIIYLDFDTIINANLEALFDIDVSNAPLAAVPDFAHLLASAGWTNFRVNYEGKAYTFLDYIEQVLKIGNLDTFPYINSGVLLINLDEWRRRRLGEQVVSFLSKHKLKYPDQDSLNRHLSGDFIRLDARWNSMAICAERSRPILQRLRMAKPTQWQAYRHLWYHNPWIIHFAGAYKPWIASDLVTPLDPIWWHFAAMSPLAQKIERDYVDGRRAAGIKINKIPPGLKLLEKGIAPTGK